MIIFSYINYIFQFLFFILYKWTFTYFNIKLKNIVYITKMYSLALLTEGHLMRYCFYLSSLGEVVYLVSSSVYSRTHNAIHAYFGHLRPVAERAMGIVYVTMIVCIVGNSSVGCAVGVCIIHIPKLMQLLLKNYHHNNHYHNNHDHYHNNHNHYHYHNHNHNNHYHIILNIIHCQSM